MMVTEGSDIPPHQFLTPSVFFSWAKSFNKRNLYKHIKYPGVKMCTHINTIIYKSIHIYTFKENQNTIKLLHHKVFSFINY